MKDYKYLISPEEKSPDLLTQALWVIFIVICTITFFFWVLSS